MQRAKDYKKLLSAAVLAVACGGDDGSGSGGSGTQTDSTASATEGSQTDPMSTDTADTADSVDTGSATGLDTTASGSGSETEGETDGPMSSALEVLPSSVAVLEADEMGELTVECLLYEGGAPVAESGPSTVSLTPAKGWSEMGGVYTFPDAGLFDVTCEVEHEGALLQSTRTVAVLSEAIDPGLAELGAGLSQSSRGMFEVLAANEQDDELLIDAVAQLDASLPLLLSERVAGMQDVLREMPGDYPMGAELEAIGIMPNADDAALGAALDDLDAALASFETTMAAIDPASVDEAPLRALEAELAQFEAAVTTLMALEPSAHGLMEQRARVASLVRDRVQPTMHTSARYLSERVHIETGIAASSIDGNPGPLHFGLLGFTLGMFNQSHIRVRLINEWYGDYLAQLDESINNFILAGALDIVFPPSAEGPVIEVLQASASLSFATPGYPSWIDGYNFDESDGGFNLVLVFGDSWQGIVDTVIDGCGIEESDSIPEAVEKFRGCVEDLEAAVDSIFWYPVSVGPGLFGSEQGLDMGPFPAACGGGLPTATFVLPMTWQGRGPSYFINCI